MKRKYQVTLKIESYPNYNFWTEDLIRFVSKASIQCPQGVRFRMVLSRLGRDFCIFNLGIDGNSYICFIISEITPHYEKKNYPEN
jgi:hypothetical protein